MVPPHLGNMSNLQYLDLNSFPLSPYQFIRTSVLDLNWLSGLSSLRYLDLRYVDLHLATTHWVQALNMLPTLSELHLQNCGLDYFPQSLPYLNFTSLSLLDLSVNNFNSTPVVPQWLFNITSLTNLDLSFCSMKGLFSHFLSGDFCNFRHVALHGNGISGDISVVVRSLSQCNNNRLEGLYLASNQLSGQLPESLGYLKNLRSLELNENLISGTIPASIERLSNLELLGLSYNKIKTNGSILESLGKLEELIILDLYNIDWDEATLSENHLKGFAKLKEFAISSSDKACVFNVSHGWVPSFSLRCIFISNCQMGPRFPAWLKTQTQLSIIYLSGVSISDSIPHWLWKISPQIKLLDLSSNQIGGVLPISLEFSSYATIDLNSNCLEGPLPLWSNVLYLRLANNSFVGSIPLRINQVMSSLQMLDLSMNFLNGSIPSSVGKMEYLVELHLSNNHFYGKIHDRWGDLQGVLQLIDLSENKLSGNIPASICSLPRLGELKLSGNSLSGDLPLSLKNCRGLMYLDLGENKFTGYIPKWIGESLLSLAELRIRANLFIGNIPEQLCRLSKLHALDLAFNDLSGSIPKCLGNLSGFRSSKFHNAMKYSSPYDTLSTTIGMELVVKGRKMMYTHTLALVNVIDLSSNDLIGEIPEEIMNLLMLGTLNLSHNKLIGKIPEKIGSSLLQLETLDLSCNHLSGQIPPSMSSMTFLNHLNLSHNNLSGQIPSSTQFQTFDDPSIYEGNLELCGSPLSTKCPTLPNTDVARELHRDHSEDEIEDKYEKLGFYVSTGLGFAVGFWTVCGSLVIKRSWRHAYFRFADEVKDWVIGLVAVNVNRLKRMNDRNRN